MFKAFGFTATMHQESWFMCGFHMSHEGLYVPWHCKPSLTPSLSSFPEHICSHFTTFLVFSLALVSYTLQPSFSFFFLLHHQHPIYSHPLPVHLPLTHGQVCPCVASFNRKCIMDVTFLSISTTKSHTPLCSQ